MVSNYLVEQIFSYFSVHWFYYGIYYLIYFLPMYLMTLVYTLFWFSDVASHTNAIDIETYKIQPYTIKTPHYEVLLANILKKVLFMLISTSLCSVTVLINYGYLKIVNISANALLLSM